MTMRMVFLPLLAWLAVVPVAAASPYECLREIRTLPCESRFDFRKRLERVHEPDRRDASLRPASNEFAFTQGPVEIVCRETPTAWMKTAIADFRDYLETSMQAGGGKVRIETGDVEKGYETTVSADGVVIRAKDDRQAAQALFHLEDVMNLRRAPFLPFGTTRRVPRFSPRMVHSGLARDDFPHGYLMRLAHAGMDTVLLFIERAGLSACNTHNGTGDEIDCGAFIRRMRDYGFDTYIYLQATGFKHPSDPDAPAFFDNLYGGISKTCPGAKGYIVVDEKCHFPSKDPHVCQWDPKTRRNVDPKDPRPRPAYYPCSDYHDWLKCVTDAILRYSPRAEIVFWTYAFVWAPYEPRMEFIRRMPKDMSLMATFEMGLSYEKRNGFRARVNDYSISEIGPGPFFREQAGEAVRQGLKVYSQANTAGLEWDFGTIPYNPVPYQWHRRWEAVAAARQEYNLRGVMECHHYGVWPSFLTELEKEAFTEGGIPFDEHLHKIAARDFGAENVMPVLDAWKAWSEAIADMPATSENQYGPFRMGPAFLYNAFQPELTAADWWQGTVPWHTSSYAKASEKGRSTESLRQENELFKSMVERYFDGAARFCRVAAKLPEGSAARERALRQACLGEYMGRAVQTALNIREGELAERAGDRARAVEIARRECANVRAAIELLERDSRLGWEPTMGYQAGVEACRWKIDRLERLYGGGAAGNDGGYRLAQGDAAVTGLSVATNVPPANALYRDPRQPVEKRVEDLIRHMELREKFAVGTMTSGLSAGGIPRIGLADFRTPDGPNGPRTEAGEGKPVTYFPAPIAYAACWDKDLAYEIGRALGEETRGIYRSGEVPARMLLGPTVNVNRSPLGGRAFENFGEDPVLAGKTAAAYCRGLQSVRVSPCIKHYLLNDQEWCRVMLDVDAPERAVREIYARPFEIAVREADVWSVMNSYNAVRGKFAANSLALQEMLFGMGFTGSVFADWGGFKSATESYNAGTTMWTGEARDWKKIDEWVRLYEEGAFDKARFEDNLRRNLRHAFRIGAFDTQTAADRDEQGRCEASIGSRAHLDLAYRTAAESFVLLKNENAFLPLDRSKIRKVAVVGPGADQHYSMIDGRPEPLSGGAAAIIPLAEPTVLEAFVNEFGKENVIFAPGFRYHLRNRPTVPGMVERNPVAAAREADLVVFCGGTDHDYDQEASGWGYVQNSDKPDIDLKGPQARLIERLAKVNPNIVVALNIGSPVAVEPWDSLVKGIVVTWYSGQTGSKALCDMIIGRINPSGRLPYTFGRELEDWPCHRMGELCYPGIMTNILEKTPMTALCAKEYYADGIWVGYRGFDHFGTEPKYPFGFGLSYTTFEIRKGLAPYSVEVRNVGGRAGRCVVQCYVAKPDQPDAEMPVKELVDFASVELKAGEVRTVTFEPKPDWRRYWSERENGWRLAEGESTVLVGTSSGDLPVRFAY